MFPEGSPLPLAEQQALEVTHTVESLLVNKFGSLGEKKEGGRENACGYTSTLVDREARLAGGTASIYQTRDVHTFFGEQNPNYAFTHAFAVATLSNQKFLVDLTYCQFVQEEMPDSHLRKMTDPFVQKMYHTGYVPLTDTSLREYLRITTINPHPDYLKTITVENFELAPRMEYDYDDDEIKEMDAELQAITKVGSL